MNTKLIFAFGILASSLAACSSTTSSSGDQFGDFLALADSFGEEFENVTFIDVDDLPENATLSGFMAVNLEDDPDSVFLGDATVTADFDTGSLTGSASNFGDYEVTEGCDVGFDDCTATKMQSINGSLDLDGDIVDTEFRYVASGILSGQNLETDERVSADLEMYGYGGFATVDETLVAVGGGDGDAILTSQSGTSVSYAENILIVSE